MTKKSTKKKKSGVKLRIIRDNAYWKQDEPVEAGTLMEVGKAEADKLVARGIGELA